MFEPDSEHLWPDPIAAIAWYPPCFIDSYNERRPHSALGYLGIDTLSWWPDRAGAATVGV